MDEDSAQPERMACILLLVSRRCRDQPFIVLHEMLLWARMAQPESCPRIDGILNCFESWEWVLFACFNVVTGMSF